MFSLFFVSNLCYAFKGCLKRNEAAYLSLCFTFHLTLLFYLFIYYFSSNFITFLNDFFLKLIEKFEEIVGFRKGTSKLYATIDLENSRSVGSTRVL